MKAKLPILLVVLLIVGSQSCKQQESVEKVIDKIHSNALNSNKSHEMLRYLCSETPGRLPGTAQSEKAIKFVSETLKKYGADSVWLVPVKSPGWKELKRPVCKIIVNNKLELPLNSISLGQCISTEGQAVTASVIEITSRNQIDSLGENGIKGKIVFFNGKMLVRSDYGRMAWQRTQGASLVSKYGAVGVLVRSLTTRYDDDPHTGVVRYSDEHPKIPAIAISSIAADTLAKVIKQNPDIKVYMETFCENPGLIVSHNVLGEIRGSTYPDEVFLLSGHLDAWHNTQGAHDDGGGIAQITDVIRIFKELGIKPKRTIRVLPYMDEEQYLTGMIDYAAYSAKGNKKHLFEIEVDNGIGIPYAFNIQADSAVFTKQEQWRKYLGNKSLNNLRFSNSYAKDWPLYKTDGTILSFLVCRDDDYFAYHHSANDVFEAVDKTNLQKGSAALATLFYLLDYWDVIGMSRKE